MHIKIGYLLLGNLKRNKVSKDDVLDSIEAAVDLMPDSHVHTATLQEFRDYVVLLKRSSFIITGNGTLRYFNSLKTKTIAAMKDLSKTPGLDEHFDTYKVIEETMKCADDKIEKRLAARIIKLISPPD